MSKIRISCLPFNAPLVLLKLLRKVCPSPLMELKAKLLTGEPIYQAELFTNEHELRDREIRNLLTVLDQQGAESIIEEILHDQSWNEPGTVSDRISREVLMNILNTSLESYDSNTLG